MSTFDKIAASGGRGRWRGTFPAIRLDSSRNVGDSLMNVDCSSNLDLAGASDPPIWCPVGPTRRLVCCGFFFSGASTSPRLMARLSFCSSFLFFPDVGLRRAGMESGFLRILRNGIFGRGSDFGGCRALVQVRLLRSLMSCPAPPRIPHSGVAGAPGHG